MPKQVSQFVNLDFMTVPRRHFYCGTLLPVFGVGVSMTFHLMFSSVWVAE